MVETVALLNHGKCSNDTNSSRPRRNSQKPCPEMFATSTWEVRAPSSSDFILPSLQDLPNSSNLMIRKSVIRVQLDPRFHPELRFSLSRLEHVRAYGSPRERRRTLEFRPPERP